MIEVGAFRETHNDDSMPSIFAAIQEKCPTDKDRILEYMKKGRPIAMAPGYLVDKIDGETTINNLTCFEDGVYSWRSDAIYYFDKYNIKLPDDFVEHVLAQDRQC